MEPFEVLVESGSSSTLPASLEAIYGRGLSFPRTWLFTNFVASVDGVVNLGERGSGGTVISGRKDADRFLMALLRASADVVLIGAQTLRADPRHRWTAEAIQPDFADDFAAMREAAGRSPAPLTVVVTRSGDIDPNHPGLRGPALVLTTPAGVERLRGRTAAGCRVEAVGTGEQVDLRAAVEQLRAQGHDLILSEAGPNVCGQLIDDGLVDELFLTISPVIAGRDDGYEGLVAGRSFLPDRRIETALVSLRRHGEHLFLRERIRPA